LIEVVMFEVVMFDQMVLMRRLRNGGLKRLQELGGQDV